MYGLFPLRGIASFELTIPRSAFILALHPSQDILKCKDVFLLEPVLRHGDELSFSRTQYCASGKARTMISIDPKHSSLPFCCSSEALFRELMF